MNKDKEFKIEKWIHSNNPYKVLNVDDELFKAVDVPSFKTEAEAEKLIKELTDKKESYLSVIGKANTFLEDYEYATIPVEELYSIELQHRGVILPEEIEKVKQILNIDETTTKQELTAIRNSIVRYFVENSDRHGDIDTYDTFYDKMSAFTAVIDEMKLSLPESLFTKAPVTEPIKHKVLGSIIETDDGFNIADEEGQPMLNEPRPTLQALFKDMAKALGEVA